MPVMHTVYLGFGSNLGQREQAVFKAVRLVDALEDTRLVGCARLYESPALLPESAPEGWNVPFINTVASYHTALEPRILLQKIQEIEAQMGKQKRGHWAPREIDIDILAYDDLVMEEDDLVIPHPEATRRAFVLLPWNDIASNFRHPVTGDKIFEYVYRLETPECHAQLYQAA